MTRIVAREIAVHLLYELDFAKLSAEELLADQLTEENFAALAKDEPMYEEYPEEPQLAYIRTVVTGVSEHRAELDQYIEQYAVGWRLRRIPKVAAAILRVAMFEVLYLPEVPDNAAISAAVELAKRYEDQKVVSFLNGILGSFVRNEVQK